MQSPSLSPSRAREALGAALLAGSFVAALAGCSSNGASEGTDMASGTGGTSSGAGTAGARAAAGFAGLGGAGGSRAGAAAGGAGSSAAGSAGLEGPPAPMADGFSAYERECHGDTAMCVDVDALRCLGIRDDTTVYGYSCSNPCSTDADCSDAPSSAEARAGCVDFATQKHCLLVCSSGGTKKSCPTGMSCYVYPGAAIGYCLWP